MCEVVSFCLNYTCFWVQIGILSAFAISFTFFQNDIQIVISLWLLWAIILLTLIMLLAIQIQYSSSHGLLTLQPSLDLEQISSIMDWFINFPNLLTSLKFKYFHWVVIKCLLKFKYHAPVFIFTYSCCKHVKLWWRLQSVPDITNACRTVATKISWCPHVANYDIFAH